MSLVISAWAFLRSHKKYWLGPIAVMLIVVGILFVIATGARVIPIFHPLF